MRGKKMNHKEHEGHKERERNKFEVCSALIFYVVGY
jgi:hypothetical protein